MKQLTKKIIYIFLLCAFFAYGISVGLYKIFPFPQLLALKHYVEYSTGSFESQEQTALPTQVVVHETFLQRLLIKKVQIHDFSGHGGGLSTTDNFLYIITNKGAVKIFDIVNHSIVENSIPELPMNFDGLIQSGHPYKNDFRIHWFRVNGVYSEYLDNKTHILFASHNAYDADRDCITHNISRTILKIEDTSVAQESSWETIFTASPCIDPVPQKLVSGTPYPGHISGGAIINFDDHNLLISVGDYDRHGIGGTDEYAMDSSNPYGKFILVDKNSGNWSVYATGSRNATGLYIDRNSVVWSVENGPAGGDELNIIEKNGNYGWPKVSLGIWYEPAFKLPGGYKSGTHPVHKKPVFSWIPSVAPSGLIKVEGKKFEYWQGDLLMATMRDQSIHRLRLNQHSQVIYDEKIPIGHRIRDLAILPDDKIVLISDDAYLIIIDDGGSIFNEMSTIDIERMASLENFDRFNQQVNESATKVYENSAKAIYQQNCATCHNLDPINQIGPNLYDLFNRQVGSVNNFNYSQTLKNETRMWDDQLLKSFLENPERTFPGNRMQKIKLSEKEIDSIVQFLKTQGYEK